MVHNKKNIQNCPPNPVIAGFHPIYDLKLPLAIARMCEGVF